MFPIPFRDMEISVTLTRPCTCVGSARYLASLQLSFSLFPSEQNLLSSENIPEMANAACLAAPGSPASLPMHTLCSQDDSSPSPGSFAGQQNRQNTPPGPWSPMGWVFSTSQDWAASDGRVQACISKNTRCFLKRVFETICLPATCDCCCPNRVQDRQGSPANTDTLKKVLSAHPRRLTFSTEHVALLHL